MCRWVSPHGHFNTSRQPARQKSRKASEKCPHTWSSELGNLGTGRLADCDHLSLHRSDLNAVSWAARRWHNESPTPLAWVKNFRKYANRPTAICTYKCNVHFIDLSRDTRPTRAVHKSKRYAPHCRPLATCSLPLAICSAYDAAVRIAVGLQHSEKFDLTFHLIQMIIQK